MFDFNVCIFRLKKNGSQGDHLKTKHCLKSSWHFLTTWHEQQRNYVLITLVNSGTFRIIRGWFKLFAVTRKWASFSNLNKASRKVWVIWKSLNAKFNERKRVKRFRLWENICWNSNDTKLLKFFIDIFFSSIESPSKNSRNRLALP